MRILFIHQNLPAQFGHLIRHFAASGAHNVVCISRRQDFTPRGVGRVVYQVPPSVLGQPNGFLSAFDAAVRHGMQVARAADALASKGFTPDIILAHPGWGESLYIKEIFPNAPFLHYCEFFYRTAGADVNFNPSARQDLAQNAMTRGRNAHLLLALETGDWGVSPTHWQKSVHPQPFLDRISVRFDGIDTDRVAPDPGASLTLPDGTILRPGDPVVTYVARGLEPYRGFPSFMRAIPSILRGHPTARVVVVGADETFYGPPPGPDRTWRQALTEEITPRSGPCALPRARTI